MMTLTAIRNLAGSPASRIRSAFSIYDPLAVTTAAAATGYSVFSSAPGDAVASGAEMFTHGLMPAGFLAILATNNIILGAGASILLDSSISRGVGRGLRWLREVGNRDFHEEISARMLAEAWTMRQRMARDMASSVFNARQWLGREASFLHG